MGGIALDQVQFPLAAFEDGVVDDQPPLVVVGPGLHLAADRAGEVVGSAQVIHVTVQARVVTVALGSPGPLLRAGGDVRHVEQTADGITGVLLRPAMGASFSLDTKVNNIFLFSNTFF